MTARKNLAKRAFYDVLYYAPLVVSNIYSTKRKNVCTLCVVSYDLMGISVTTLYVQIIL